MGRRLEKRLEALEAAYAGELVEEDPGVLAYALFLKSLTRIELAWMCAPLREGELRVPCPHVESIECRCGSEERRQRAVEAFPAILEEYRAREAELVELVEERLAGKEEATPEADRRRAAELVGRFASGGAPEEWVVDEALRGLTKVEVGVLSGALRFRAAHADLGGAELWGLMSDVQREMEAEWLRVTGRVERAFAESSA